MANNIDENFFNYFPFNIVEIINIVDEDDFGLIYLFEQIEDDLENLLILIS